MHPDTREVVAFRRGADGLFKLHDFSGAARFELDSVTCTIDLGDLFDGVEGSV